MNFKKALIATCLLYGTLQLHGEEQIELRRLEINESSRIDEIPVIWFGTLGAHYTIEVQKKTELELLPIYEIGENLDITYALKNKTGAEIKILIKEITDPENPIMVGEISDFKPNKTEVFTSENKISTEVKNTSSTNSSNQTPAPQGDRKISINPVETWEVK